MRPMKGYDFEVALPAGLKTPTAVPSLPMGSCAGVMPMVGSVMVPTRN
jgi:hypothetical protein